MPSTVTALFGSETRAAVLGRLLLAPDSELHLRDLVRATGFSPRAVNKEVDRLVEAGFLLERRSSNRRYLRANTGHPLYRPLRQILEKTVGIVPLLREALGTDERIVLALLFGSTAAATERAESDVDLLVVGPISLSEVLTLVCPVQETLDREISPVVMSEDEFQARRERKEHFLSSVLSGETLTLVGDLDDAG